MNRIFKKAVFIVVLCSSTFAWAQGRSGGSKHSFGAEALFGVGSMGNGEDVKMRQMSYIPVALFYGYNMKLFRVGGQIEYSMVNQMDAPADFSNQNLSGSGMSIGLRLGYYDGTNSLDLIFKPSNTYNLSKTTVSGESLTFKGSSGIGLQYYRRIKGKMGFVIDYTKETFTESVVAPSKAVGYDRISIGLVFTNFKAGR